MYPVIRLAWQFVRHRNAAPLGAFDTHISHHICWPWDLDVFAELNNGRVLTLYDMGRLPMSVRSGFSAILKKQGWGMTMAGATIRYRRRVRMFDRVTIHSRAIGHDERFFYLEHAMFLSNGDCASHGVFRSAVTDKNGIVTPDRVTAFFDAGFENKALPDWVQSWIASEADRPWPPMQNDPQD